jgi:hypothetical protein
MRIWSAVWLGRVVSPMIAAMTKLLSLSFLVSLFAAACTADPVDKPAEPAKTPVATVVDAETVTRDVKCGCSIEAVGHCGNYVMIEGKYVPLIHASLGKMEFCKFRDAGAKIKVKGAMSDGKYVAKEWQLAQ